MLDLADIHSVLAFIHDRDAFYPSTQDFHGIAAQADFLLQFAIEGFFRGFSSINPALGELPGIPAPNPPGPEQLAVVVGDDYTDIGSEAF